MHGVLHLPELAWQQEEERLVAGVGPPEPLVGGRARAGAVEDEGRLDVEQAALEAPHLRCGPPQLGDENVLRPHPSFARVVVLLGYPLAVRPEEVGQDRAVLALGLLEVLVVELAGEVEP